MSKNYETLIDEIMELTIKTARGNGVNVMGLVYPALNVRESLKNWFLFAEDAPELPTKEELNLSGRLIGQFEAEAHATAIDKQKVVGVWTDGVMLTADNGNSKMMPGIAPCAFKLKAGQHYKVTVEEVSKK
ncbi:hypothetical protein [Alteromonas gracilis]|uniref:hypothetical protein n=1 Tax=Alteromonas gracilis TaxID=1479524 RepID=UPI0037361B20